MNSRLTLIRVLDERRFRQRVGLYKCECGNTKEIVMASIRSGLTKSCGCLRKELGGSLPKHGLTNTKVYRTWRGMKTRCYSPKDRAYEDYGARGISVCDRWLRSFENFLEDMGEPPTDKHSIDRIDVNGNYEPSNCRWATRSEQQRNKRNSRVFTINGETRCLAEWCEVYSVNYATVLSRLKKVGCSIEIALTKPIKGRGIN